MGKILVKRFEQPDEINTASGQISEVILLGETYIARSTAPVGWQWSKDMKPLVGTPSCEVHHQGMILSGRMEIATDEGIRRILEPGDVFDIHPGHDGLTIGDEPCVFIEFHGVREWGKSLLGARILTTLLYTDIVGSTALAAKLGDAAWNELLSRHYSRVRKLLERYRGEEIKTTGDGLLAIFDGTARAVRCALAISEESREDGIELRAGVHAGEVERYPDGVHGLAVHVAARVMAIAGPGEILITDSTSALLEGAGLDLAFAGEHELRGLSGPRRIFSVISERSRREPPAQGTA